jgi:hypothetical protein
MRIHDFVGNVENTFVALLEDRGLSDVFASFETDDMPEDRVIVAYAHGGVNGVDAEAAQRTGTGSNEAKRFTGTLTIIVQRERMTDTGAERAVVDSHFSSIIAEDSAAVKYSMLMGSIRGTMAGMETSAGGYYCYHSVKHTGEDYEVGQSTATDSCVLTYELDFSIKPEIWNQQ